MSKLNRKVAMCFMAHPDDCEILAAGTLALLAKKGWKIHIVTATPGDCGSAELPPTEIAAIRRQEAHKAAKVLGGTYHCLEARDLYVTFNEHYIREAVTLTRMISPTLVITHSLVDYMMDHEETAKIVRSATFGYAIPNTTTGAIAKHARVPYLYYADPVGGVDPYGEPIVATTLVNITKAMTTKEKSLKAHASQREWLLKHHGMDHYVQSMKNWNELRGKEIGVKYAEGFRQHKGHPYPQDCILKTELAAIVKP